MGTRLSNTLHVSRLRPLAACLAIAFSGELIAGARATGSSIAPAHLDPLAARAGARDAYRPRTAFELEDGGHTSGAPDQPTTTLLVTNCDDAGPDSLRAAIDVANANDGYTIAFDLSQMPCGKITLTSGEIAITTNNLTLQGPGADLLTIDGDYSAGHYNRIFKHSGQGTLAIRGLTLADAKYASNASGVYGGCILSAGAVSLVDSTMQNCLVTAQSGTSKGGAISASSAYFNGSRIANSSATSLLGSAVGGAVHLDGISLIANYSAFENNSAHSYSQNYSGAGGALALAGVSAVIQHSTLSGNKAERAGAIFSYGAGADIGLLDSTISGNTADNSAVEVNGAHLYVYNTTIAFNTATTASSTAGVVADSIYAQGSIFANNVASDTLNFVEADIRSMDGVIGGAKNLILAAIATTPPADTSTKCPRLAPLLNNGGQTRTHALLPDSPAIDEGNDTQNLGVDQRGAGFARVVGAFADIGAYEWGADSGDDINNNGFDNCK